MTDLSVRFALDRPPTPLTALAAPRMYRKAHTRIAADEKAYVFSCLQRYKRFVLDLTWR
jgi:hypothetical protein